tara:strand:- start:121 stop:294 length:174 start_codon:yes stop_codon:yes gene_type:complete
LIVAKIEKFLKSPDQWWGLFLLFIFEICCGLKLTVTLNLECCKKEGKLKVYAHQLCR